MQVVYNAIDKNGCTMCVYVSACEDHPDFVNECPGWAASGECVANPEWMPIYCKKSCNTCVPDSRCQFAQHSR